jgi:glutamyl-tRNA synthetase
MGKAYADNLNAEEMKVNRDAGIESVTRNWTVEQNLKIFDDMCAGKIFDYCIRAKMNMQDKVGCLRDPVFYRTKKDAVHHRTGTKYKAYPTYDLAIAVIDSAEGVTHALRTVEYADRDALYVWVQKTLGLREVTMYEFAKLNLVHTCLSKRKLKWFVENDHVSGWNDPRFPTVQGIMRRGMTTECLKDFMLEQGPSRNTNLMEWDKLWSNNKGVIDPITPRYMGINKDGASRLTIENGPEKTEGRTHDLHQKNKDLGTKVVMYGKECFIEKDDAELVNVEDKITLMKWGNVRISKKETLADGTFHLTGTVDEKDMDFKKTAKLHWLCADPATYCEITTVSLGHLINKKKIEEDDKIEDLFNRESYISTTCYAEGCIKNL